MKFALSLLQMFRLLQSFKQFGNIWKISNTTEKLFVTGFKRKILKTLSLQRKILFGGLLNLLHIFHLELIKQNSNNEELKFILEMT